MSLLLSWLLFTYTHFYWRLFCIFLIGSALTNTFRQPLELLQFIKQVNNIIMSKAVIKQKFNKDRRFIHYHRWCFAAFLFSYLACYTSGYISSAYFSRVDYLPPPSMSIRFGGFRWYMLLLILIFVWCWLLFGWSWVTTWHNVVHVPFTYNSYNA